MFTYYLHWIISCHSDSIHNQKTCTYITCIPFMQAAAWWVGPHPTLAVSREQPYSAKSINPVHCVCTQFNIFTACVLPGVFVHVNHYTVCVHVQGGPRCGGSLGTLRSIWADQLMHTSLLTSWPTAELSWDTEGWSVVVNTSTSAVPVQ